jgi:hypothetical protein
VPYATAIRITPRDATGTRPAPLSASPHHAVNDAYYPDPAEDRTRLGVRTRVGRTDAAQRNGRGSKDRTRVEGLDAARRTGRGYEAGIVSSAALARGTTTVKLPPRWLTLTVLGAAS